MVPCHWHPCRCANAYDAESKRFFGFFELADREVGEGREQSIATIQLINLD